jgi:hypothetical protein
MLIQAINFIFGEWETGYYEGRGKLAHELLKIITVRLLIEKRVPTVLCRGIYYKTVNTYIYGLLFEMAM